MKNLLVVFMVLSVFDNSAMALLNGGSACTAGNQCASGGCIGSGKDGSICPCKCAYSPGERPRPVDADASLDFLNVQTIACASSSELFVQ